MSAGDQSRVLFISSRFAPFVGGVETQSEHLARALSSRGEKIDILTMTAPGSPRCEDGSDFTVYREIRVVPVRGLWGVSHFAFTLWFLLRMGRRYRLVMCYQMQSFHNPAALLWGKLRGRPVVVVGGCSGEYSDFLTLQSMASGRWLLTFLKKVTAYVALSEVMREEMIEAGLAAEKIAVIPNGVDMKFFQPATAKVGKRDGLVFVGRLSPQKGLPWLLEAFSQVAAEWPGLTLALFGEGPEEGPLRSLAASRGLEGRVLFEGTVSAEKIREALAGAAAIVQPSIGEGLSCTLLEAMAMECPVIATDLPVNRVLISDRKRGLLVPPRDASSLARAIRDVLKDPSAAASRGRAARRLVAEKYSIEAVAARYAECFDRFSEEDR